MYMCSVYTCLELCGQVLHEAAKKICILYCVALRGL